MITAYGSAAAAQDFPKVGSKRLSNMTWRGFATHPPCIFYMHRMSISLIIEQWSRDGLAEVWPGCLARWHLCWSHDFVASLLLPAWLSCWLQPPTGWWLSFHTLPPPSYACPPTCGGARRFTHCHRAMLARVECARSVHVTRCSWHVY